MVDYQYRPDPDDSVTKLRYAMKTMDGEYMFYFSWS